jgi:prepilin-type N-terminal cleavage/methylation domain-containing protein
MNHARNHGFTLIELMLSMTFISVLLVAIAMTTIQISNIYNRGITLREVNQVGRAISDDIQRSIASSTPFDVTPQVDNSAATADSKYVVRDGGGRLCLGSYTYAWNYGNALKGGQGVPAVFNKFNDNQPVRFVKVADASGSLCDDPEALIVRSNTTDLLSSGDRDLALHKFSIVKTAEDASVGQALYAISMTIGTNDRAQLTSNDASCRPPAEGIGSEDYCSVNQFEIVARAGNRSGGE